LIAVKECSDYKHTSVNASVWELRIRER
jgi:hypothetical protein